MINESDVNLAMVKSQLIPENNSYLTILILRVQIIVNIEVYLMHQTPFSRFTLTALMVSYLTDDYSQTLHPV